MILQPFTFFKYQLYHWASSSYEMIWIFSPGNPYWKGRLSTIELLLRTSLNHLFLIFQKLFTFLQYQLYYWASSSYEMIWKFSPGNPYWKGRLSTADLLLLSSLNQLLLLLKTFLLFTKQANLMRRSIVLVSLLKVWKDNTKSQSREREGSE